MIEYYAKMMYAHAKEKDYGGRFGKRRVSALCFFPLVQIFCKLWRIFNGKHFYIF